MAMLSYETKHRTFRLGKHHNEALKQLALQKQYRNDSDALRAVLDTVAAMVGVAVPTEVAPDAA